MRTHARVQTHAFYGVFHPIFIKFGLGANIGLKRTLNEFDYLTIDYLTIFFFFDYGYFSD